MKVIQIFIGLMTLFIYLPFTIYGSYLLYKHVQATDLMWFIWWLTFPMLILSSVINVIMEKIIKKI